MKSSGGGGNNSTDPTVNGVMVQFAPQQPGEYPAKMVLRSSLEVRVFDVLAVVKAPQKKRMIDFEAPAREVIVQEVKGKIIIIIFFCTSLFTPILTHTLF